MDKKIKLTKRSVDSLKAPAKDQSFVIYWDDELPGFGLRITPSNVRAYILQYRIHGRQRRYTIGRHGVETAETARQRAKGLLGDITKGIDPQGDKKRSQGIPTLNDFKDEYLGHAKAAKKTWEKDAAQLKNRILPKLGQYRLDTISTHQIESLHHKIKLDRTPATANRHLALIKRMFSLAVKWGYIADNPAQGVKSFKENNQRTAWLDAKQIEALLTVCRQYSNPHMGGLFPFLLFTGARLGEALAARWDNVDLDRGMWLIPEAKSGKGRYVPLSPQAVETLRSLPREQGIPYVFCGQIPGKPIVNVAKPWKTIRRAAKLPEEFRIHDLRHTFASWGVSNGIDLYHIQALLGHSSGQMTQRYSHLAEGGIKASINHIGDHISRAISEKPATENEPKKKVKSTS